MGSVESILSLKQIVTKEAKSQPVVVVVSALGGITDKLIATSKLALAGDERYRESFDEIVDRHHKMIDTIITDTKAENNFSTPWMRCSNSFAASISVYSSYTT